MKTIVLPILWLIALFLALLIAWRIVKGRPIILRSGFSAAMLRRVAIILMILGVGVDAQGQEGPGDAVHPGAGDVVAELPPQLTEAAVQGWYQMRAYDEQLSEARIAWTLLEIGIAERQGVLLESAGQLVDRRGLWLHGAMPAPYRQLLADRLRRLAGEDVPPATMDQLQRAVASVEEQRPLNHWEIALIWRMTRDARDATPPALADLLARLELHARMENTLIAAAAVVRPVPFNPRAWMSKAGPRQSDVAAEREAVIRLHEASRHIYPATTAGTWREEVTTSFTLTAGQLHLIREGQSREIARNQRIDFARLDLLQTPPDAPATLTHPWLGEITLPAGETRSVWTLPAQLSPAAMEVIAQTIGAALAEDEQAVNRLEQALPLVHPHLSRALQRSPHAPGAPALHLLLLLFHEMPAAAEPPPP